jgi:pyruvate carboxylase subunit A
MEKVIREDKEKESRLKSTFLPSKSVAAVSAAVNSYMSQSISQNKK